MIEIDGSFGEGGGSIVRLSCALSALTDKPFKIKNIRAGRSKPGLRSQHLASVKAISELCNAKVKGMYLGSKELVFHPGSFKPKNLKLDIGTAGSIPLVLQALMILSLHSPSEFSVKLIGGTNTKNAPTMGYLKNVTLEILRKIGYKAEITVIKHGFYPLGKGIVEANFYPCSLSSLKLVERGRLEKIKAEAIATKTLREKNVLEKMKSLAFLYSKNYFNFDLKINVSYVNALSDGASFDLFAYYTNTVLGSSVIGEKRKSSSEVVKEAFQYLFSSHKSGAPLDFHIADQILPYLALVASEKNLESEIRVERVTRHAETNMWLLKKFINVDFSIKENIISIKRI